jgi:hypothetical protein
MVARLGKLACTSGGMTAAAKKDNRLFDYMAWFVVWLALSLVVVCVGCGVDMARKQKSQKGGLVVLSLALCMGCR